MEENKKTLVKSFANAHGEIETSSVSMKYFADAKCEIKSTHRLSDFTRRKAYSLFTNYYLSVWLYHNNNKNSNYSSAKRLHYSIFIENPVE